MGKCLFPFADSFIFDNVIIKYFFAVNPGSEGEADH